MSETLWTFLAPLMHPIGLIGLLGQCLFFSRFLVQWIVSERRGESHVPLVFWYLSIGGGVLLLIYALWQRDPVITLGQAVGIVVYTRNLALIRRTRGGGGNLGRAEG
jgi:lipid-A-disaccharide synthase-like uncharacterized protein